jgi:hypothetical protein
MNKAIGLNQGTTLYGMWNKVPGPEIYYSDHSLLQIVMIGIFMFQFQHRNGQHVLIYLNLITCTNCQVSRLLFHIWSEVSALDDKYLYDFTRSLADTRSSSVW